MYSAEFVQSEEYYEVKSLEKTTEISAPVNDCYVLKEDKTLKAKVLLQGKY